MQKTARPPLFLLFALMLVLGLAGCAQPTSAPESSSATSASEATASSTTQATSNATQTSAGASTDLADAFGIPGDDYKLEQVVVLSRHNIRSPLSDKGSTLSKITPYEWFNWTSKPSELSLRGGVLETINGQFFRQWLEAEGLIPENWHPEQNQVRFFANSLQRTMATAQYFSSGMLPVANASIQIDGEFGKGGATFLPLLTWNSDAYEKAARAEISTMDGAKDMSEVASGLAEPYKLLADVIDYTGSEGYKSGEFGDWVTTDTEVSFVVGKEPAMTGSLKTALSAADALVLQSYEEPDLKAAAFGNELTEQQWKSIASIVGTYTKILFTSPLVAKQVAHPLLAEIGNEMDAEGRVFSFLCGHDSSIASVAAALGVEDYELPGSVEPTTPIGVKMLFERWSGSGGNEYGRIRLVYQSADQLRAISMLGPQNMPQSVELNIEGMSKNADGLYDYTALRNKIQEAADAFDQIKQEYADPAALPEAA